MLEREKFPKYHSTFDNLLLCPHVGTVFSIQVTALWSSIKWTSIGHHVAHAMCSRQVACIIFLHRGSTLSAYSDILLGYCKETFPTSASASTVTSKQWFGMLNSKSRINQVSKALICKSIIQLSKLPQNSKLCLRIIWPKHSPTPFPLFLLLGMLSRNRNVYHCFILSEYGGQREATNGGSYF